MPTWPETLPAFPLADGFSETLQDTALRTPMDQGPAKVRQRTTAGTADILLSYVIDRDQAQTLESFYRGGLSGGTLAFDFVHPRTEDTVSCRFKKPPAYVSLNGERFRATLELEILP